MTWWPVTTHKNLWKNHPSPRSQLELAKGPIFFRILGPFLNGAAEQLRERWADSNTMGSKWAWLRLAGKITITQTWLFVGTIYSPKHTKMIRFLFFSTQKMDQLIEWTKLQILWNSSAMIQACQSLVDGSSGFDIVYSRYICNVYIYHYCILYIYVCNIFFNQHPNVVTFFLTFRDTVMLWQHHQQTLWYIMYIARLFPPWQRTHGARQGETWTSLSLRLAELDVWMLRTCGNIL